MLGRRLAWLIVACAVGAVLVRAAPEAPTSLIAEHPRIRLSSPYRSDDNVAIKGAELHYFFLRGLGEVPRLLLELTQTPYDSVMYFSRKDPKDKEYKAIAPFGQMPLYTDDELGGTWLAQQGAIVRHIARRLGLGGKNSKDEALIDMLFEGAKDIQGKKDFVHEGAASESADAVKLKMYLAAADKILGDKSFFVYDSATYADVAMFHVLSTLEEIVGPGSSYLTDAGFPRLVAYVRRFRDIEPIKAYLASVRRVPLTEKELGKGSTEYIYTSPLSPEALNKIDTNAKPEL